MSETQSSGLTLKMGLAAAAAIGVGAALYVYYASASEEDEATARGVEAKPAPTKVPPPAAVAATRETATKAAAKDTPKAAAAAVVVAAVEPETEVTESNKLKEKANKLFKEKKFAEAASMYSEAIAAHEGDVDTDPLLATLFTNRAAAYIKLKQYYEVVEDCTKALSLNGEAKILAKAYSRRAHAYDELKNYPAALHDYMVFESSAYTPPKGATGAEMKKKAGKALQAIAKGYATAWAEESAGAERHLPPNNIIVPFFNGFSDDSDAEVLSVEELTAQIASNSEDGGLYLRRARANVAAKNYTPVHDDLVRSISSLEKAEGAEAQALKLKAMAMKGVFQHLLTQHQDAVEMYSAVITADDTNVDAYLGRAMVLLDQGKQACKEDYDMALKLGPKAPSVLYHLGQYNFLAKNVTEAIAKFREAIERGHQGYMPHLSLAQAFMVQSKFDEALAEIKVAEEKFPGESTVFVYKGQALQQQGQAGGGPDKFDQAEEAFNMAFKKDKGNPMALFHLGYITLMRNPGPPFGRAVALFENAVKIDKHCFSAIEHLGHLHMNMKDFAKAGEWFDMYVKNTVGSASHISQEYLEQVCVFRESAKMYLKLREEKVPGI